MRADPGGLLWHRLGDRQNCFPLVGPAAILASRTDLGRGGWGALRATHHEDPRSLSGGSTWFGGEGGNVPLPLSFTYYKTHADR